MIKAVWLCSWSPKEFIDHNLFFGKKPVITSPWIDERIKLFKNEKDVEIHIISIYSNLLKDISIVRNGVHYHLLSKKMWGINRGIPYRFLAATNYKFIRNKINKKIDAIDADIVECHGSDSVFAAALLDTKIPVIITVSTIMVDLVKFFPSRYNRLRLDLELQLYKKVKHWGVRSDSMQRVVLEHNPKAITHWYNYPINMPNYQKKEESEFDILFAAGIVKNKGIEDLIHAIEMIKSEFSQLKVVIVGYGNREYQEYLEQLVDKLDLSKIFVFKGYLPSQDNVFEEMEKAKVYVIPTHFDLIPGSLVEAIHIGVPSIAYDTGGIPELNKEVKALYTVPTGNVNELANSIKYVLNNYSEALDVAKQGQVYINQLYDNSKVVPETLTAYKNVIQDFQLSKYD